MSSTGRRTKTTNDSAAEARGVHRVSSLTFDVQKRLPELDPALRAYAAGRIDFHAWASVVRSWLDGGPLAFFGQPLPDRIAAALREEAPLSAADIARRVGDVDVDFLRQALCRMAKGGRVARANVTLGLAPRPVLWRLREGGRV